MAHPAAPETLTIATAVLESPLLEVHEDVLCQVWVHPCWPREKSSAVVPRRRQQTFLPHRAKFFFAWRLQHEVVQEVVKEVVQVVV